MKAKDMACLLLVGLAMACALLLPSCRRTEASVPIGEQELPDMVLENADYTLGKDVAGVSGDNPMVLHADLITMYSTGRNTELQNVSFRQGDGLSGSCRSASVASDNKSATLSGDVVVHQAKDGEEITITSQDVVWNDDDNTLVCTGIVQVEYSDGTKILAEGLFASIDENSYEFNSILEGSLE